jgi:Ca2+-binding RTX toxin-like protein
MGMMLSMVLQEQNYIDGGNGNDTIYSGTGADRLFGGSGNDVFRGESVVHFAGDIIDGGSEYDGVTLIGRGSDTVDYSLIDTTLLTNGVNVTLLDDEFATVTINDDNAHVIKNIENIIGTAISDTISGDIGNNTLVGGAGTDTIRGIAGNNVIYGDNIDGSEADNATSNDLIYAGTGDDIIYAGKGLDTIYTNMGSDTVYGGDGNDTIYGGEGSNRIFGGNRNLDGSHTDSGNDTVSYELVTGSGVIARLDANLAIVTAKGYADVLFGIQNVTGTSMADEIVGSSESNTLIGGGGNDIINGLGNNNRLEGGSGNDTIISGSGNNIIDGGEGSDTVDYSYLTGTDFGDDVDDVAYYKDGVYYSGIKVDLTDSSSQRIHVNYGSDTITNIENVIGSSKNDYIVGNDENNILDGKGGNDYFLLGQGIDTILGDIGNDTVAFSDVGRNGITIGGVIVDLSKNQTYGSLDTYRVINDGFGNAKYLDSIENIIGTSYDDTIYGNTDSNTLIGGAGNDTLRGSLGANVLDGGAGEDWAYFDDIAVSGVNIVLDTDGISANGSTGTATLTGYTNTLIGIEHIKATALADIIRGDHNDNSILSGGGNDTIYSSRGSDYIDGGEGHDTVDYARSDVIAGVNIDLSATQDDGNSLTWAVQNDGYGNAERLYNIENIVGTSEDDFIKGNGQNNTLIGGAGDDTLYGVSANNILVGGAGSDTFRGGIGDNIIYGDSYATLGGVGTESAFEIANSRDLVDFSDSGVPVTLNLSESTSISYLNETTLTLDARTSIGFGKNVIYNVEDVLGGSGADILIGSEYSNVIDGANGNDIIFGFGGNNNTLIGGAGNDTILGLLGGDVIYGGTFDGITATNSGQDWVDYSYITDTRAVNIDLSLGSVTQIGTPANADTLTHIESAKGTKNNDTLKGDNSFDVVNSLFGYKGDDSFIVSKGSDYIDGGEGFNTMDYSSVDFGDGGNRVIVDLGLGKALDNGYHEDPSGANIVVEDTLLNIQKVIGTSGNDELYGNSYANVLIGGAGNDYIDGREGDDTIYGISGNNKLFGSAGADTIYGGTGNDTLSGGADNDILDGSLGGNNTYIGGTGDDTMTGGAGRDTLYYAASESGITVTLKPSGEDGTIVSSTEGTDTLKTHFEVLVATNYKDIVDLRLASADSTILAYGGNDTIYSSSGYGDTIYGGDSNDVIYANGGNNVYYGGNATLDGDGNITGHSASGDDTVNYSLATSGINVNLSITADGSTYNVTDNGFDDGQDKLYDITRIVGSDHDDIIKGSSGWNYINAGAGDDWIIATNGGDTIYGGSHTAGDGGGDWLSFEDIATSVNATMASGTITGGLGTTTIFEIENLFGSLQADILRGDTGNNTLHGNDGNDTIYGVAGNNFLVGGEGDDTLVGGSGIDRYDGGDTNAGVGYIGGVDHGTNTISFYDTTTTGVIVNLGYDNGNGTFGRVINDGFGNVEDYVRNISNIIGTLEYQDTLIGNDSKNIIWGYGGHDVIYGVGGENTIYGGTGNDTVYTSTDTKTGAIGSRGDVAYGGQGIDTFIGSFNNAFLIGGDENGEDLEGDWINYSSLGLNGGYGISVNLESTTTFTDTDLDRAYLDGNYSQVFRLDSNGDIIALEFDYLSQIEHIQGTSGIDLLMGKHGENNSIMAGGGDDTVFLSSGINHIDGEAGNNWISLQNMGGAISNFDLANNNAGDSKIYNIQNVIDFDGNRGQTVWGSNSDNTFIMYGGNDHVLSRGGNNIVDLGTGDDRVANNYGSDTLIGGTGQDTLDMYHNLGANQGARVIFNSITATDYNSMATGIGALTLSNQTVVTSSIEVSGLATLDDGSHNFYRITDGRGSYDYLYQDGTNPDFEQFYMTGYADIFVGSNNNDTVHGYGGNDTIWAMGGDDSIYGGDGDDTIFGVSGNNILQGGAGNDIIFGGTGNDNIQGTSGYNTLYGKAGNNVITGGTNDDIIYAGTGTDNINGGNGEDTLRFDGANTRVVVNLGSNTLTYDGVSTILANRFINSWLDGSSAEQTGTVTNIENVDGTNFNDTIRGNDEINSIRAGAGDDYIFASYGNDYINGGTHTNGDWLDFSLITTYDGVNIDLEYQRNAVFKTEALGDDHNQVLDGIEHIIGTAQDDLIQGTLLFGNTLRGGDGADTIKGVGGSNYLYGDGGNDTIFSGTGNDYIDGGAGTNTVTYEEFSANVRVNISDSTQSGVLSMRGMSGSMTDTLVSIQNITTGAGADTIWGSSTTNIIRSGAGNDTIYTIGGDDNYVYAGSAADIIYGADGRDTIYGEDGNDTIIASGSDDYIDGGGDIDIVNYSASTQGLNITLADSGALTTITLGASNGISASGFSDSLYNIEGLVGSSTATNILIGNNMNNSLIGGANTDTIKGISGNNYLNGGAGADTIYSGTGSDMIIGGSLDENWLYYTEVGGANVNVNLRSEIATYGASTDTIVQIRHLYMGNGTNIVEGNSYANSFVGGSGIDTLSYSGSAGSVTVNVTSDGAGTTSGDGADTFLNFENYTLSGNADTINLSGVYGSTINGGGGSDTTNYGSYATGLTVTVDSGNTSATVYDGTSTDTLQSIEKIIGGAGNDTFIVSNVTGIDTLDGGGGINTLQLSGDIDLSSVTLLNFDSITVADGDTLTVNATDLDGKTMTITLNGTGSLIIVASALASDHDFDNITVTRAGSGDVTLQVDASVNLIGRDINGVNNIIDIIQVNSGTVTLSEAQVTAGTVVVNGVGSAVVEVSSSTSTDFGTILQLTTATNETVRFTANSTFSGDFGNSNIVVNSGVTMTTTMDKLSGKTSVLSGAGNITITDPNISALEANAVAGAISGVLTATITTGAVTTTLNAIGNVSASDVITFTTNDTTVDASDLVDLSAKVDTFGVGSITNITEAYNTANVATEVVNALNITGNTETVTITGGAISAANVNTIANATTGVVTATITTGAVTTTLNAITNVNADDVITFTTNDTTVDASDLVALAVKVDNFNVNSITNITEAYNTANVATEVVNALNITGNTETVTITGGAISVANANTIANATSGVVTATVTADTASSLNSTLVDGGGQVNAFTLTLTDTTLASVDDLIALDGKTSVAVNASSVTTITDTYADLNTLYTAGNAGTITGLGNEAVTISDTQSAANVNNILIRTSGVVTATVTADTASSLNTALANATSTDALTLTVTNDTGATLATNLTALDSKTSVTINATAVTSVTGTGAQVAALASADITMAADYAAILTGTSSASDVNTVAGDTTGIVTATVTADTAANLNSNLSNAVDTDALTLTVNGATATATDLIGLDNKTSVDITVNASNVTGNFSDLNTVYVTNQANYTNLGDENVTINDTVSATNANTIANATSGVVTATVTADTASSLNSTLVDGGGQVNAFTLTLTDTTLASVDDLIALDGKTSVAVNASSVTTITDTYADLYTVYTSAGISGLGNEAVTISDTQTASNVNNILNRTSGIVTAIVIADTAAALNTNLANATSSDALTLTLTDTTLASVDNLIALDGKTSVAINASSVTTITDSYADLNTVYTSAGISGLGNENVTLSDTTMTAANLSTLNTYTTGTINATNVININGTLAEVNALYAETGFSNLTNKTVNLSTSGSFNTGDFSNIDSGEITTLNFAGDVDTMNFTDKSNFDTFKSKFTSISTGGGNDEFTFSSAITEDLDFSNITNLETLSFGAGDDTITFGSDEFSAGIRTLNLGDGTNVANLNADTSSQVQVNGGSGNDEFVLDFSRINQNDYQLDGGAGSDTVKATGAWTLSSDMNFASLTSFDNIETLDLSGLSISGDPENDFIFSGDMVSSWTDASNSLTLKLSGGQDSYIDFVDVSSTVGNTVTFTNGATLTIESV